MVSYWVRYRGRAAEPARFISRYQETHSAILKRFSGIKSLVLHTPVEFRDPFPVNRAGTMLLAQMTFDSAAALNAALASEARKAAREDFQHFPRFDGEVTHEAMEERVIF
jgi:uncharacterized protein (TIGR02118 family)